jgi:hypothetical protein
LARLNDAIDLASFNRDQRESYSGGAISEGGQKSGHTLKVKPTYAFPPLY